MIVDVVACFLLSRTPSCLQQLIVDDAGRFIFDMTLPVIAAAEVELGLLFLSCVR